MQTQLSPIYYIIFTAVTALGVLLQAFVLLAMYLAIRKAVSKMHAVTDEFKVHALPTVATARSLLDDVSPKLKIAAANLVEASHSLRYQADHVNSTVDEVLNRTNVQVARVDEMTTALLNTVAHATVVLQQAAAAPIRQISGVLMGLKTGFDVLRRKRPATSEDHDGFGE
jgi:hypothetical protein